MAVDMAVEDTEVAEVTDVEAVMDEADMDAVDSAVDVATDAVALDEADSVVDTAVVEAEVMAEEVMEVIKPCAINITPHFISFDGNIHPHSECAQALLVHILFTK